MIVLILIFKELAGHVVFSTDYLYYLALLTPDYIICRGGGVLTPDRQPTFLTLITDIHSLFSRGNGHGHHG